MSILLLRLSGPLQSWGSSSRFTIRTTQREPTKSAVIGLLASAQGRQRGDDIEDLLHLSFGVRIDQPGILVNDMQTEHGANVKAMPLTKRYYLSDAKFLVALGADPALLEGLDQALRHPRWPLYLGRRACPPDYPVSLGLVQEDRVDQALRTHPWMAASWYKRRHRGCRLEVVCDADCVKGEDNGVVSSQADIPLSFGAARRYAVRTVSRYRIPNPDGPSPDKQQTKAVPDHDPMSFF